MNNEFITIYMIICQNPIDKYEVYVLLIFHMLYRLTVVYIIVKKSVFIEYTYRYERICWSYFVFCNFADFLKDP